MTVIDPFPAEPNWPAEWQGSTLTGRFLDTTGKPVKGNIKIKPSPGAVVAALSQTIIVAATRSIALDATGEFTVDVPATDDPDMNPTGWTYLITEDFPGGRSYSITAPMNVTQDLSLIAPVPAANGATITRGLSAYEVAVANGFVGTEQEWLDSLHIHADGGGGTVADATTTTKGVVQLAGDLGGTASAPTVPGLASKVEDTDPRLSDARAPLAHTHTLDEVTDTATRVAMAPAERTKLGGVADGATANATDAALRDRSTHTGTQPSSTITDFTEAVQDAVAALLAEGTNVTLAYNDAGDQLTITAAGGGAGGLDAEGVRDAIGVAMVGLGNITVTPNDAADTITITTTATQNSTDAQLRDRATHTGTQDLDTTTDSATRVAMTPTERTKLAGVADGATANATDAQLRDRSTHTGSQDISTVNGLQAALDARVPTIVLGPTDPVPGGLANPTIIVRTS